MDEKKKMTLEEYQEKYSKPENLKSAKLFLRVFTVGIGVVVFTCLFFIVLKLFEIHQIAGYVGIGLAVLAFIFFYLVPIIKIASKKAFITNVDESTAKEAQRYNKALRNEIADKMIDLKAKTDVISFYSDEKVGKLAIARQANDNEGVKTILTDIYQNEVKTAANKMIRDHAIKVGLITALSQSEKLDTLFVVTYELKLIKDLVFLYGFRPSDTKLVKIYKHVIIDALASYGVSTATTGIGPGVVKQFGKMMDSLPILGSAVGTLIDSTLQGIINAAFTVSVGFQTKRYLRKEYKLQNILDSIEINEEEEALEEKEIINSVNEEIKSKEKNRKAAPQPA